MNDVKDKLEVMMTISLLRNGPPFQSALFKENAKMTVIQSFKIKFPYIYYALVWTPILALLVLFTGGAGHGTRFFMAIIYPYTVLESLIWRESAILYSGFLFILQYPIYGTILTIAERKQKLKKITYVILITHVAAIVICMAFL